MRVPFREDDNTGQAAGEVLPAPVAFNKRGLAGALSVLTGASLLVLLLYYLPASGALEAKDPSAPERLVAYALMVMGLMLVFVPLSAALKLGPVWLLGAGSWWMLGYVLFFVSPGERAGVSFFTYAAFLAVLFVALASLLALPMAGLGRFFLAPLSGGRGGISRALRQGALLSLAVVSLLAMSPLGVLNWLNALLVFTIVALTEFFFMARD
jgi:hypothetical protein